VWFVDADDKIFDGSLARIVSELSESSADVVCFDYFYMKDGKLAKRFMDSSFAGVYSGKRLVKFYEKMIYSGRFFYFGVPAAMWNKVFRRELALANMENVDLRIRVHEDGLTSYGALLAAEKIAVLREHLYVYRADNASTTRGYRDRSENMKLVISSLREISARFAAKSDIAAQIDYYALYQVWGMSVDLWVYKGIEGWFKKREYVAGLLRIPEVAEIRPRVSAAGMSFLNRGFVAGFKRGIPGLMLVFAWLIAAKKYWRGILG
jgi:hypothetical protein